MLANSILRDLCSRVRVTVRYFYLRIVHLWFGSILPVGAISERQLIVDPKFEIPHNFWLSIEE